MQMNFVENIVAVSLLAVFVSAIALYYGPLKRRYECEALAAIPLRLYLSFEFRCLRQRVLIKVAGVSSSLSKLHAIDVLSPSLIRILGPNPGRLTLQGTNTYLVGEGPQRVLIDCSGGEEEYIQRLKQVCEVHGVNEITDLLLTHAHLDHIGGLLRIKYLFPRVRVWKYLPSDGQDLCLRVTNKECEQLQVEGIQDGFEWHLHSGLTLRAHYAPGHCVDHVCFFLTGGDSKVLFSGDCILGHGSSAFDSLYDLTNTLHALRAEEPDCIYPGHGPIITNADAKIQEYLTHRQERENQILDVLSRRAQASLPPMSSAEIVSQVYQNLPITLHITARKSIDKHLEKLIQDKRVQCISHRPAWWKPSVQVYFMPVGKK